MGFKRKIKVLSKIFGGILLLAGSLLLFGFYTHPNFVEQQFILFSGNAHSFSSNSKQKQICREYCDVSSQLNDSYFDYIWNSAYQKFGDVIESKDEIRPLYLQNKLSYVDSSDLYVVDSLFYSYAFLTKDAKKLLEEVGARFQEKLKNTTLSKTRILVTSLLRTENTVKRLRRTNRNSIRISSHLHGTTFDLAHNEFVGDHLLDSTELRYLKEQLAETLNEFRKEKRCFVTYEINQACFHIVNRNDALIPKKTHV